MQGRDNTVSCNAQVSPPQIGRIAITGFDSNVFLFDGRPSDLPIPPQFTEEEVWSHCSDWERWLTADPRIYTANPGGGLWAVSGKGEQVDIVDYRVELYDRKHLDESDPTFIVCGYGGGSNAGYILDWDTVTQRATLIDLTEEKQPPRPIPPASINVSGPGFNGIALTISSKSNYLYSGRLVLTAIINGKEESVSIGNEDNPHRWVGGGTLGVEADEMWDWNPVSNRWVKGLPKGAR